MSLTTNELRIGNRVYSPVNKCEGIVVAIETGGRPIIDIGTSEPYTVSFSGTDCLSGIPLSPEVLEALGFEFNDKMDWYVKQPEMENIEYRVKEVAGGWRISKGFFKWDDELTLIHFVHELQNVYFAIQQGELTYNKP